MPRKDRPPKGTNPVGAPPFYKTALELKAAIDSYFDEKLNPEPKTITGLAYHLGFESRQSIYDYIEKGEFSYILKRSKLKIESIYEARLHGNNPAGAIFYLKNSSWSDRQEIVSEVNGKVDITATVTYKGIEVVKPEDDSTESTDTGEKVPT